MSKKKHRKSSVGNSDEAPTSSRIESRNRHSNSLSNALMLGAAGIVLISTIAYWGYSTWESAQEELNAANIPLTIKQEHEKFSFKDLSSGKTLVTEYPVTTTANFNGQTVRVIYEGSRTVVLKNDSYPSGYVDISSLTRQPDGSYSGALTNLNLSIGPGGIADSDFAAVVDKELNRNSRATATLAVIGSLGSLGAQSLTIGSEEMAAGDLVAAQAIWSADPRILSPGSPLGALPPVLKDMYKIDTRTGALIRKEREVLCRLLGQSSTMVGEGFIPGYVSQNANLYRKKYGC